MKKLIPIMLIAFLTSANSMSQEIKWVTFEEALVLQKKKPKKIMMDVYTNWCGPCKMLDRNTFQKKQVADYVNEHYYAVKFNAEGNDVINYKDKSFTNANYNAANANRRNSAHDLTRYLQVNAYPTIVFFDDKGEVIAPIRGYQKPSELELYLKMFKNDDHKNIKTQDEFNAYYKAFVSNFKD